MKTLILAISIILLAYPSWAIAPDVRISDADSTVMDLSPAGTNISSTGRTIVSGSNSLAVAGTAEVLGTSTTIHSVILRGHVNNLGPLYIGPSTVDSTGYSLMTGIVVEIKVDNIADIFFDGDVTNDTIEFIGIVQ